MSLVSAYETPWGYGEEVIAVPTVESFTPKGVIVSHNFPTSAEQGVNLPWNADVHNVGTDGQIAIGINNVSGNPGDIVLTFRGAETVIPPGYYFRVYTSAPVPNCHHLIESGSVRFEAPGSYVIKLWGMWFDVERQVWVYYSDEEITKNVAVQVSWPHTVPIHVFSNKKLKAESWELGKSATESIIDIDTSLLQGGKLEYTVQYIQGTPLAEIAKIWFDGTIIVEERLSKGEARSGSIDLTGFIGRSATITISFDSMFGFWSEVLFDVWLVLGFSEEPPTPPGPAPFDWMEWLRNNAWWISLGVLGTALIIMSRKGTPIVIYQPPRQRGKE